jgi:predicted metal-dependent HD superfamily phosphohydrolase
MKTAFDDIAEHESPLVATTFTANATLEHHAEEFARRILAHALPSNFTFHNLTHTEEVVAMATEIGRAEGLNTAELHVVTLAAWFHDIGYTEAYERHEEAGASIARHFLTGQGCPFALIECVTECIMATKMPQSPKNLLECVLCDADVANLGTEAFLEKSERLRNEIESVLDICFTDEEWYTSSLTFCQQHQFHTSYARTHFAEQQAANAAWIELFRQYKEHRQSVSINP